MTQESPPPTSHPTPLQPPTAAPAAQRLVLEQRSPLFGRFGKLALIGLVICLFVILGMRASYQSYFNPPTGPQEKFHSLNPTATKKVAILDISGTIMKTDGFIKQQIDRIREDKKVVAVVLRINSPGGTVGASDYLYHHLNKLRNDRNRKIPIVVSMGGLCASGGYYLAMAVGDEPNTIFAEPSTWTGSIGVVIPHYDLSGLLARFDVKDDSIASHPYKLMGSPTRELSEEEKAKEQALLQALVDESFARFKKIVQNGRPIFNKDPDALDASTTGQIFSAEQALQQGLVDRIGFVEDAIARAVELAGTSLNDVRCVKYKKTPGVFDAMLGIDVQSLHQGPTGLSLGQLFDLAAPRAYYLWTATPPPFSGNR